MTPASSKQKAMFFALAHDLGYPAEVVEERAKQHFGLASFTEITTEQLSELLDCLFELQTKLEQKRIIRVSLNRSKRSDG
jgi:CMP-2-keto-3-deoxyoctulosonic acid synthetase